MGYVNYKESESNRKKEAITYTDFKYTNNESVNLLKEITTLTGKIITVSDEVNNALQDISDTYDEFTSFNDLIKTCKSNISGCISGTTSSINFLAKQLSNQLTELVKTDESFLGDLETLNTFYNADEESLNFGGTSNPSSAPTSTPSGGGGSGASPDGSPEATTGGGGAVSPEGTPEATAGGGTGAASTGATAGGGGAVSPEGTPEATAGGGTGAASAGATAGGGGTSQLKPSVDIQPSVIPSGAGLNPSSSLYNKLGGDTSNLNSMISWLKGKGLNNAQIAGIIGNSALESGLQLNAKNPKSSATGLFQWLSDRHPSGWDFETQMNHMWTEYTSTRTDSKGNPVITHMDGITDPTVACQQFCKYFEGASSGSKREQYARDAFEYLNSNFV